MIWKVNTQNIQMIYQSLTVCSVVFVCSDIQLQQTIAALIGKVTAHRDLTYQHRLHFMSIFFHPEGPMFNE